MTEEELSKVKFKFVCHMSMENMHTTTCTSEDGRLGFQDNVPFKNDQPHGKGRRYYRIDTKWYKTKEKFLEALSEFSPKIVPIRK